MLQIRKSSSSAPLRILYQGMVMCRLASTVSAVSDMHCERCVVTEGSIPADRRRGYVDQSCWGTVHAAALLQQVIITLRSRARRCDVTTRPSPACAVR
jgi:hypothetical protein